MLESEVSSVSTHAPAISSSVSTVQNMLETEVSPVSKHVPESL